MNAGQPATFHGRLVALKGISEIERRATARHTAEHAEYEQKLAGRKDKEQKTGGKSPGGQSYHPL